MPRRRIRSHVRPMGCRCTTTSRLLRPARKGASVAGYFLNLGLVSAKNGLLDQAIAHYQKAALLDPVLKSLQFWLGNAFMQQGKFSEAASCYARELQVSPESYPTITNLGNALRKLGRHEQAITCYQKAISLQLSHPDRPSN